MGCHGVCRNPFHRFSREDKLEIIYDNEKDDWMLYGLCEVCGMQRVVYMRALKNPEVINAKLNNVYTSNQSVPYPSIYST